MFSKKIVNGFMSVMTTAIRNRPNDNLLAINIRWRSVKELNQSSQDVINFTSFLIEQYPEINRYPISMLPHVIDLSKFTEP